MSAKMPLAAFAVLMTAISSQGTALAQNDLPARNADQGVNRFSSKIPSDARALQGGAYDRAFGRGYPAAPAATQQPNESWRRTYPEFPFQNGGGG
jgi:hypothetical protein